MKKKLKEIDKLEKQALVERIQQRDQEKTDQKNIGSIVENQDFQTMSLEDLKKFAIDLRHKSRARYLQQREEQILDLRRRTLEDNKRVFSGVALTEIE